MKLRKIERHAVVDRERERELAMVRPKETVREPDIERERVQKK